MPRFIAIEGARAWLAWAVVFAHINETVGLDTVGGRWGWFGRFGGNAVLAFVVISGFVIAHLVIDRREAWLPYITRRAFRIFPAYWVAYAVALLAFPFALAALPHHAWINDPLFTNDDMLHWWQSAMDARPAAQIILHILLLQGLVPDSLWPGTASAVLGPAWSLTLEWQFYLVGPVLIGLIANKRTRIPTIFTALLLALLFRARVFGAFSDLSTFLPGSAYMFIIGIGCRLAFDELKTLALPVFFPFFALAIGLLYPDAIWLGVWLAVLSFVLHHERWAQEAPRIDGVLQAALSSPIAQYLGARSYSVYLIHLPLIWLLDYGIATSWQLSQPQLFLALTVTALPATLIASDVLHRLVERPMMKLGAQAAKRGGAAAPAPVKPA